MPKVAVYLLGDSITQGLGSKKVNFTGELERLLGDSYEVANLAFTGTTVDYALKLLDEGKIVAGGGGSRTVCVILYGNVDAQIRPSRQGRVFPRIPKRYQGGGMLMPRPFYSRSPLKRLGQRLDNLQRKAWSGLIKVVDGTEQWVGVEDFSRMYGELLNRLSAIGVEAIACSCVFIDEKLFPGCVEQYEIYNEWIRQTAGERGISYVDFYSLFRGKVAEQGWDSLYNKDHFHPNGGGYEVMARVIAEHVRRGSSGDLN